MHTHSAVSSIWETMIEKERRYCRTPCLFHLACCILNWRDKEGEEDRRERRKKPECR